MHGGGVDGHAMHPRLRTRAMAAAMAMVDMVTVARVFIVRGAAVGLQVGRGRHWGRRSEPHEQQAAAGEGGEGGEGRGGGIAAGRSYIRWLRRT